jgi:hypothetical protein
MKFVCLIHHDLDWFDDRSTDELQALHDETMAYDEVMEQRGQLVLAQALRSPSQARSVRRRRGKTTVVDGPFAESKEQLIGFFIVEAKDMAEAVAIAEQEPFARSGTIVVREGYEAKREGPGS